MKSMVKSVITYKIRCKVSFWLKMYLYGVKLFSYMSGLPPDFEKVNGAIKKGVKFEVIH
jgi:hypothetical protein